MVNGVLVFIPSPAMGHLVAEVELAKRVVARHQNISVTVLIPKLPVPDQNLNAYIQSSKTLTERRISLIELPLPENAPSPAESGSERPFFIFNALATLYKPIVKREIDQLRNRTGSVVLGFLADMLFTQVIDVADELEIPSYILYPSGANLLAMSLHLESLGVDVSSAFAGLPPESTPVDPMPGFKNPVALLEWPEILFDAASSAGFLRHAARYRRTRGILVNTYSELESELLRSLRENGGAPAIYPIGPILHVAGEKSPDRHPALIWLDEQPKGSVVFLCFGSNAAFDKSQVEQIAVGVERSGCRFLWSLRRSSKGQRLPSDYDDFEEVLPSGFLDRTSSVGKIIGWAPQTEVLAHESLGAFVSHCGWNSVLESLWFGVPIVGWPMYAEQHLNAFLLVRELGLAVELTMDCRYDLREKKGSVVVPAEKVERAIRRMMEEKEGLEVRIRVKEISRMAREALGFGGSSTKAIDSFVQDLIKNLT